MLTTYTVNIHGRAVIAVEAETEFERGFLRRTMKMTQSTESVYCSLVDVDTSTTLFIKPSPERTMDQEDG